MNRWTIWLAIAGAGFVASQLLKMTTTPASSSMGQLENVNPAGMAAHKVETNVSKVDTTLPSELERVMLEIDANKRNPFMVITSLPKIVKQAPKPLPAPALKEITQTPQPPMMPPLDLKFIGRLTEAGGNRLVFVSLNENPVTLSTGQTMPNGFRIDVIKDDVVELTYLPLGTTTRFDLPKPLTFDIR